MSKKKNIENFEDVWKWIINQFPKKLRNKIMLGLGIIFLIILGYEKLEIVNSIVTDVISVFPTSLPNAEPGKFSVYIANLEDDNFAEIKNLILEDLEELEVVQILSYNSQISNEREATDLLKQGGGEVFIWGKVLWKDNHSVPKLYFTPSDGNNYNRYPLLADNSLPDFFWDDLASILQLQIISQYAYSEFNQGRNITDKLIPYINKLDLLYQSENKLHYSSDRTLLAFYLANAMSIYGEINGSTKYLNNAFYTYQKALADSTMQKYSYRWFVLQNNSAATLLKISKINYDYNLVKNAINILQDNRLRYETTNDKEALEKTLMNLGMAYGFIAEYSDSLNYLFMSYKTMSDALSIIDSYKSRTDYAIAKYSFAITLGELGYRLMNKSYLNTAIKTHYEVLKIIDKNEMPIDWALNQSYLGKSMACLFEIESNVALLDSSIILHQNALQIFTKDLTPFYWANAQMSLSLVYLQLAQQNKDSIYSLKSVIACRKVLEVFTKTNSSLRWQMAQNNFGAALKLYGDIKNDTIYLLKAVIAFENAISETSQKKNPFLWAARKYNIANAKTSIGILKRDLNLLKESLICANDAGKVFSRLKETSKMSTKCNQLIEYLKNEIKKWKI